jgi:PcfJ-like protein
MPDNRILLPGQGVPNPVALFRDDKGVYGIGLADEYLEARGTRHGTLRLILRPDRVDETEAHDRGPILQGLPPWHLRSRFNKCHEGMLRGEMIAVMRQRAGIPEDFPSDVNPGPWNQQEQRFPLRSSPWPLPAHLRSQFFGLASTGTRMFNGMMAQVVASADPEALRVARRFALPVRWLMYKAVVRSHRLLQLAESFPFLAYHVFCKLSGQERDQAIAMVEDGAKLRDVAQLCGLPMRLRKIKPGAANYAPTALINRPELLDRMPSLLPQQRRWLEDIPFDLLEHPDADYVAWVARNWAQFDGRREIENIGDWARSKYQMGRPFMPTMSVHTVRQLSAQWHEDVEQMKHGNKPFPEPWFAAETLVSGEDMVPITNSKELTDEGRAMHNCVATYADKIIRGSVYIYSLRKGDQRIATIELRREASGRVVFGQIRGPCNAPVKTSPGIFRWLASQNALARDAA